jgi:hypothetical protein
MARNPRWQKRDVAKAIDAIAQDVATFFNVEKPAPFIPEGERGRNWEYRTPRIEVWTKAGQAELCIDISANFAHLYFRFDDPTRAIPFDDHNRRLNRHSGKWNHLATPREFAQPQDSLDVFRAELRRDFRKVAQAEQKES